MQGCTVIKPSAQVHFELKSFKYVAYYKLQSDTPNALFLGFKEGFINHLHAWLPLFIIIYERLRQVPVMWSLLK